MASIVKITDEINNDSSDIAASAKAVKTAYDRGSKGISDAKNAQTTANNALPKSGGTMTGPILLSSLGRLGFTEQYAYFTAIAANGVEDGAFLALSLSKSSGNFNLSARNSSSKIGTLIGTPEGKLTWDNKDIVRSVNHVNADENGNVNLSVSSSFNSCLNMNAMINIGNLSSYTVPCSGLFTCAVALGNNQLGAIRVNGVDAAYLRGPDYGYGTLLQSVSIVVGSGNTITHSGITAVYSRFIPFLES